MVNALIERLQHKVGNWQDIKESDFSQIMFSIIPYYYKYQNNYTFSPEMWDSNPFNRRNRSDGLVIQPVIRRDTRMPYGFSNVLVMYECKSHTATTWNKLAKDQLWEQADSNKNIDGKLWVIGQIGFEVCVFRFDVLNYEDREDFTHFCPLNLMNLSEDDLNYLDALPVVENIGNNRVIQAIKWKLNDVGHHGYIHGMLDYISKNDP